MAGPIFWMEHGLFTGKRLKLYVRYSLLGNRRVRFLDGVLVANELTHMPLSDRKPGVFFKIDMEKAYDYVD